MKIIRFTPAIAFLIFLTACQNEDEKRQEAVNNMTRDFVMPLNDFRSIANNTEDPSKLLIHIHKAQSILLDVYQEHFANFEREFDTEICFISNNTETEQDIFYCRADDIFLRNPHLPNIGEAGMEGFLRAYRELEKMWIFYDQLWMEQNSDAERTVKIPSNNYSPPPSPSQ